MGGALAVLTQLSQLEDRHVPTTTLEGWRRFIESDPATFELLPRDEWAALSDAGRTAYNEARIAHHAELSVVTTSAIQEISNEGRLLTLMNQRENGARRGLIVSGAAATGKTTAIKQLGRFHELRTRLRFPVSSTDRIPVVYITAPPKGSPRKLAMEFARFLALPVSSRANATDIADAVCQVLIDARCDIVIIDELHNVNMATTIGEDYSDHMKYFTEHLRPRSSTRALMSSELGCSPESAASNSRDAAGSSPPARSPTTTSGSSSSRAWNLPCDFTTTRLGLWSHRRSICTSARAA